MLPDFDKWPVIYQVMGYIGAAIAGAYMLLRGAKSKPEETPLEIELKAIRADFAVAIEALKISVHDECGRIRETMEEMRDAMQAYERRLRDAERTVAVLEDRGRRR